MKGARLDVTRFALERGYLPSYLYRWLDGQLPGEGYITRLARDLNTSPGWLAFGDQASPRSTPPPMSRKSPRKAIARSIVGVLALAGVGLAGQTAAHPSESATAMVDHHRQMLAGEEGARRDIMGSQTRRRRRAA